MFGPAADSLARRPSASRASTSTSPSPASRRRGVGADRLDDLGLAADGEHRDRGARSDRPARDFHPPPYAISNPAGGKTERIEGLEPLMGTGLGNEAAEVPGACTRAASRVRWSLTPRR